MRSAVLLLTGFALLAAGVAVVALGVPGRWVLGPVLVVAGLALKVVGFVVDAPRPPQGRTVTTLGTAARPPAPSTPARAVAADLRSWRDQETGPAARRRRAS